MKKISLIFTAIFPYLLFIIWYFIIKKYGANITNFLAFRFVLITIIMFILLFLSFIISIINMFIKYKMERIALINLLIKVIYLPIQTVLLLLMLGMMNPFLILVGIIVYVMSAIFMFITGTISVLAIVKAYLQKDFNLLKSITYAICSYCYILDIIIAIIICIEAYLKKTNTNN